MPPLGGDRSHLPRRRPNTGRGVAARRRAAVQNISRPGPLCAPRAPRAPRAGRRRAEGAKGLFKVAASRPKARPRGNPVEKQIPRTGGSWFGPTASSSSNRARARDEIIACIPDHLQNFKKKYWKIFLSNYLNPFISFLQRNKLENLKAKLTTLPPPGSRKSCVKSAFPAQAGLQPVREIALPAPDASH